MTNKQVKQAFSERRAGSSANLSTDGTTLLSYGWWEVAKWVNNEAIVRKGKSYSTTTATKHRSGVIGREASVETPVSQGSMNV